jgi:uncharacterized OB-fold protein
VSAVGTVQSHTVIRVPDKAHANQAPFVLLLVVLDGGKRALGPFDRVEPPAIGSRVRTETLDGDQLLFRLVEKS